jgi:hypothetical protein
MTTEALERGTRCDPNRSVIPGWLGLATRVRPPHQLHWNLDGGNAGAAGGPSESTLACVSDATSSAAPGIERQAMARRRISVVIAGTTWWRSPITA